jgi:hypothetical protein
MQSSVVQSCAEPAPESTVFRASASTPRSSNSVLGEMRRSCCKREAKSGIKLGRTVWVKARQEYVTGDESFAQIAARLGVTKSAVEKHASATHRDNGGKTWEQARMEFLHRASAAAESRNSGNAAATLAAVRETSADVALTALEKLQLRLDSNSDLIETKDLIGIAKLASTLRVELAGELNVKSQHVSDLLDTLTADELRAIAYDTPLRPKPGAEAL